MEEKNLLIFSFRNPDLQHVRIAVEVDENTVLHLYPDGVIAFVLDEDERIPVNLDYSVGLEYVEAVNLLKNEESLKNEVTLMSTVNDEIAVVIAIPPKFYDTYSKLLWDQSKLIGRTDQSVNVMLIDKCLTLVFTNGLNTIAPHLVTQGDAVFIK